MIKEKLLPCESLVEAVELPGSCEVLSKIRQPREHSKQDIGNIKESADHRAGILEGTIKGFGRKRPGRERPGLD